MATSHFLQIGDGSVWPDPADPGEVAWTLMYGEPSKEDLRFAVAAMFAYSHLVSMTQKERNRRCEAIREASGKARMRDVSGGGDSQ